MFSIPLFMTAEESCHYLPEQTAQSSFVHPVCPMHNELYALLLANGFRRSGNSVYRPQCPNCSACISVRVPIDSFKPNRNQLRCLKRNLNTQTVIKPARFEQEHYELYLHYQEHQHPDSNMRYASPTDYIQFLSSHWSDTLFVEFRHEQQLMAIAVVDKFSNALSAVYTFFNPDCAALSPGVYAVLWQIQHAKELGLDWLYLGYWIADCKKMRYKIQYQPLQFFKNDAWIEASPTI